LALPLGELSEQLAVLRSATERALVDG